VAQEGEVLTVESEGGAALSVCNAQAVAHPVLDIVAPSKLATDGDVAVLEVQDVHYFGDGVVARPVNNQVACKRLINLQSGRRFHQSCLSHRDWLAIKLKRRSLIDRLDQIDAARRRRR
jgi:hypothetical protein